MRWLTGLTMAAVALCATAACGRGGLEFGEAGDSGAGAEGSGAGSPNSGSSGQGASGPGSTGPGPGVTVGPGSTGGPGSGGAGSGTSMSTSSGVEICDDFDDACTTCASQNCPDIWCSCVQSPYCLGLFQCFGDCNEDAACEQQCLVTWESGIAEVLLVSGCAGTTCDAVCEWGNDGFTECQECIYQDCATETNTCFSQPECSALWQCLSDCPQLDLSCQQGCYNSYPNGVVPLETLLQCSVNLCETECQ